MSKESDAMVGGGGVGGGGCEGSILIQCIDIGSKLV